MPGSCSSATAGSDQSSSTNEKAAIVEAQQPAAATPPEGGLAGWLTVLGAFFALFASFGQSNAFGSYQAFYAQHQLSNYSASAISWIGGLQLWTYFASVRRLGVCAWCLVLTLGRALSWDAPLMLTDRGPY
jgi:hypothetical protein